MMSLLSVVLGLRLILMLSGDIELNPGPGQPPELNDVFCLLKPHSVDWQDIGRALRVNKKYHNEEELLDQGVMKGNDSKLEDVLVQWIKLQCSEVSWDHLIKVLQDDLMMADTVSRIKEYLLNDDEAKAKYEWKDESVFETDPSGPVTVDELVDSLKDLVIWETFAIHLPMISSSDIEKIAKDYKTTDIQKFHLYSLWLSQCPNASWIDVVQALHKTKNHSMAKKIKEEKIIMQASTNIDQSYTTISSLPPCLSYYSDILKHKYKLQPVISSTEWPPRVGKDYYGRLLLLDKERRDIETEQHKIWNTMRGNIDILPRVTKSRLVDIPDVLKPDSSAIVLIDGPPGVGKTTFCRKLLNVWANGQLPTDQQQRYTVVLYCSLRDKRITGTNTLTDIMKTCYSDGDDDDSIKMVSKYIAEKGGDGLLIIFDGWDELNMEHRESSLAAKFIRREVLLKCTVIVTSRSYASESIMTLSGNCKHFEVIGFGKSEVQKVIKETVHDDVQLTSDLLKELKSQTNIESLCYIPLVCSMVILVYKKSKHLPSRLTELYEKFVLHAVKRHVKKSLTISTDPKRIRSLNQLPPCIKTSFNELCRFAYLSLKENNPRMTFSLPELQEALDVSVDEGYIGLMTTVSVYDEELYQFPHLTIQEFLAAWWIADNDGMDVKGFEEHFEDDHFRMCLKFVAGLTGLKNEKFKKMKYFNMQMDLRCALKSGNLCSKVLSSDIPQRLLHLLYESNNTDLCKHIANTFIDNSFCFWRLCEFLDSFDAISMLFFLHTSGITWNKIHICILCDPFGWSPLPGLIMADTSTDVIECKELIIECVDVIRPTHGFIEPGFLDKVLHLFSSVNIHCNCFNCYCINETLITLLEIPQIKKISIQPRNVRHKPAESSFNSESLLALKKNLETTTTLEELTMELNTISSDEVLGTVIDGVMRNKSVKSLKVMNRYDSSAIKNTFKQLLKENTALKEIEFDLKTRNPILSDISEVNAPLQSVQCSWLKPTEIESVLAGCQHLQSLTIDVNKFSQPIRIPITNLFNHLPKLSKLIVDSLDDSKLWTKLFTILQTNQKLEELQIHVDETAIVNDGVLLSLKNLLILNKSIKHLDISIHDEISNFTNYLLITLTESLSSNKTIERLSLWPIDFTNEGRSFFNAIFKMESLISLKLALKGKRMDGADVYPMISSLLQQNSHIKELDIRLHMKLSEGEHHFEELFKTVYNHSTLEYVNLDLSTSAVREVRSCFIRVAKQYLYMKQISRCINPQTKVPPLIIFIIL